jgi:predicted alpha/beta hydrolase
VTEAAAAPLPPEVVPIVCDDGYRISATRHRARAPRSAIVVAPAVAVPQSFYADFAQFAASQGYDGWTFDYRGCGTSRDDGFASRLRLEDWGRQDLDAVLRSALASVSSLHGSADLFIVGHSIGGQLVGLANAAQRACCIVLVAASAPYWKRWPLPGRWSMFVASHVIIPVVAAARDRFPASVLGLGRGTLPSTPIAQWAAWMRRPDYLFGALPAGAVGGFARLSQPILSITFTDDRLVPSANVGPLLERFEAAAVEHLRLDPADLGVRAVGHVGFFRSSLQPALWSPTMRWLASGRMDLHKSAR